MATEYEVNCIHKSDRYNPHERILSIGGVFLGQRWSLSQQEAIKWIEDGRGVFHVTKNGRRVNVVVSKSAYGHKYLKTVADGEQPNNLLNLAECSRF